ncbi:hypothetical protein [Bacillus coahuilensis]|uniref:hypothetical protein n=1 Tax=Bacillus coahuilensis TaxID=408580 RepID=UPI0001850F72|nr:hypothetical protein [Bacillus coahuilensis]
MDLDVLLSYPSLICLNQKFKLFSAKNDRFIEKNTSFHYDGGRLARKGEQKNEYGF